MNQPLDFSFYNACAQFLTVSILSGLAAFVVWRAFEAYRAALLVIIETLLISIALRRLDFILNYFGADFIPVWFDQFVITWLVLAVLAYALAEIWLKRNEIRRMLSILDERVIKLTKLKAEQSKRLAQFEEAMRPIDLKMWNDSDSLVASRARALNTEIETACALNAPDVTSGGAQIIYKVNAP